MDVFWKGYYTFDEVAARWGRSVEEISAVVMSRKLIPSYFLERHQAKDVIFDREETNHGDTYSVNRDYPSTYMSGKFVYLRIPLRESLTEYCFHYGCESATDPMDEIPFSSWYLFDKPVRSGDPKIIFLKSQVEEFERIYSPMEVSDNIKQPTLYPWGDHNTRLLQALSDVAVALWSRYDPLDPSTAPTNEQVQEWLIARKVPKRTAETMATILRAEELPMGRRKR